MVLYGDEFPGNDFPAPEVPGNDSGSKPAPGGCGGAGMVETGLNPAGEYVGGPYCVSSEEAAKRQNLFDHRGDNVYGGGGSGGGEGDGPTAPKGAPAYQFSPVPQFKAPGYEFNETFQAPTFEELSNDPGYKFASNEGLRALQQSQAAQGGARTGGAYKDLSSWSQNFATQHANDAFNRNLTGYNARLNAYGQNWDRQFQGAQAQYAPLNQAWAAQNAFNSQAELQRFLESWNQYNRGTLTAAEIAELGRG